MASSSTPTACRFSGCCTQVVRSLLFLGEYDLVIGPRAYADRKSTRLNSSHGYISYAVFCLKKKKTAEPSGPDPQHQGSGQAEATETHPRHPRCGAVARDRPHKRRQRRTAPVPIQDPDTVRT